MHGSDRRRAPRVSLGSVDVRLSGTQGSLIDLSVIGALVQSPLLQAPDADVTFEIDAAGIPLTLSARVVRCTASSPTAYRVALEFEVLSMDQLLGLSRLVDDNSQPATSPVQAPMAAPRSAGWWS